MKQRKTAAWIGCFALLVLGSVFFVACAKKEVPQQPAAPIVLDSVVVQAFKGKRLSSLCVSEGEDAKSPVQIDIEQYSLHITGLVASVQVYSYQEALNRQHYRKTITLESADGWTETIECEGVLVSDLIGKAGPLPGAVGVIFRSQDGYEVSFPLEYILDRKIMLAYQINGKPLTPAGGYPFILVSESSQGPEWVKWVTGIELTDDLGSKK